MYLIAIKKTLKLDSLLGDLTFPLKRVSPVSKGSSYKFSCSSQGTTSPPHHRHLLIQMAT